LCERYEDEDEDEDGNSLLIYSTKKK